MIWVLLVALGVPICLVVGGLLAALWNRRRVLRTPDAFPCKLRTLSADDTYGRWSRGTACGRWVHDALLMHEGLALARTTPLLVRDIQASLTRPVGVRLRGGAAVSIQLRLDDGSTVDVAAPEAFAHFLSGPFLAFEVKRVEEASS